MTSNGGTVILSPQEQDTYILQERKKENSYTCSISITLRASGCSPNPRFEPIEDSQKGVGHFFLLFYPKFPLDFTSFLRTIVYERTFYLWGRYLDGASGTAQRYE